jgi:hypothetical protein
VPAQYLISFPRLIEHSLLFVLDKLVGGLSRRT